MAGLPPQGTILLKLEDLADPGAKAFAFGEGTARIEIFIVRRGALIRGFLNVCPHRATPLDWVPDQFLNPGKTRILCATHGAEFEIEDGRCVAGPCPGAYLTAVPLAIADGYIRLA